MQIQLCAVGRLRSGAENDLVSDYITRFNRSSRTLGLGPVKIIEVEDRNGGKQSVEAELLRRSLPKGTLVCALDERGKTRTSPEFADMLARWRDTGQRHVSFIIGGADGIAPDLREEADHLLSFGKMVWPHMLARVMLCEQLYRAASILAGAPYHRA